MADGLGDDASLLGRTLPHTVMVFFPDAPPALYQLRQWYRALCALNRVHRVVIVLQDSRTARLVRQEVELDVIVAARFTTVDDLLSRSNVKVALYVNHTTENFSCLRFTSLVHASLMHGDSDKTVSVSHHVQGYDFSLVAGQAAVDRLASHVPFFDAASRCITIGRPQLDEEFELCPPGRRQRRESEPPTVLYAPTWEGAQPTAAYGSVDTHGLALVREFLADGWTVLYRPHPLTGARDSAGYGAADRAIRTLLQRAGLTHPGHRTDTTVPVGTSFADADLLVTDISSIAIEWLPLGRPMAITDTGRAQSEVAQTPLTAVAPRITPEHIPGVARRLRAHLDDDPCAAARSDLLEYYLGDVTPGAATTRFVAAIDRLIALRADELARLGGLQAAGARRHANSGGAPTSPPPTMG